jgi:hypothetical protein
MSLNFSMSKLTLWSTVTILFYFSYRILLCSPGWHWILDPLTSASTVVGLQDVPPCSGKIILNGVATDDWLGLLSICWKQRPRNYLICSKMCYVFTVNIYFLNFWELFQNVSIQIFQVTRNYTFYSFTCQLGMFRNGRE